MGILILIGKYHQHVAEVISMVATLLLDKKRGHYEKRNSTGGYKPLEVLIPLPSHGGIYRLWKSRSQMERISCLLSPGLSSSQVA